MTDSESNPDQRSVARPLAALRAMIDSVDHEILQLLSRRNGLVTEVAAFKRENRVGIRDLKRESELLAEMLRPSKNMTRGVAFAHFELTCDEGELSVIARDFALTVVGKGTLVRDGGGGGGKKVVFRTKRKTESP